MADRLQISLEAARVNAGLSLEEAAEKIGIEVDTLRRWEDNPENIHPSRGKDIACVYKISIDHLYFGKKLTE